MQNTYQKVIDTLARSLASPGKIIFSSSLQLTPAFLRPGKQKTKNKMQSRCLQHSLGVMDLAAAGSRSGRAKAQAYAEARRARGRPLPPSGSFRTHQGCNGSWSEIRPKRSPQCPRAPPSRLQGRDTCWVGAPSRASSHLTPSESPGAPHWQSFRYSGKD